MTDIQMCNKGIVSLDNARKIPLISMWSHFFVLHRFITMTIHYLEQQHKTPSFLQQSLERLSGCIHELSNFTVRMGRQLS
jgi:hypothetical protein